jgi:hypothetical protein
MAKQTFHGSCKCKSIKFEAALDLSEGTSKCNCTTCWKLRWWSVRVKPEDFEPVSGDELLTDGPGWNFCRQCGVIPYVQVEAAEWNDGAYVSVNVAALDDLDPQQLMAAPIKLCDGKNDDWWHEPKYSAHL